MAFWGGVILGMFGLILVFLSVYRNSGGTIDFGDETSKGFVENFWHQLLILFSLFCYSLVLEPLGFVLSVWDRRNPYKPSSGKEVRGLRNCQKSDDAHIFGILL